MNLNKLSYIAWLAVCVCVVSENVCYLVSSALSSFAAVVRTDADKTVVVSTLETLEDMLKYLKSLNFPINDKEVSSLMTSIQDVLDNKASTPF